MLKKIYILIFLGILISNYSICQTNTTIAVGSLYSIHNVKPQEVDSILLMFKKFENTYWVSFIFDPMEILEIDDTLGHIRNAELKTKIEFALFINYESEKYVIQLKKHEDDGGYEVFPKEKNLSKNDLFQALKKLIEKYIDAPKRITDVDFSQYYQDSTSLIESKIMSNIRSLKRLKPSNPKDTLEQNYLLALCYYRLAAISKIESRNSKLDTCNIYLKKSTGYATDKANRLAYKCNQYRQFSKQQYSNAVETEIKKWWDNCYKNEKKAMLKILIEDSEYTLPSGQSDQLYIYNITKKPKIIIIMLKKDINLLEFILPQLIGNVEIDCSRFKLSELITNKITPDFKTNENKPNLKVVDDSSTNPNSPNSHLKSIFDINKKP